MQSIALPELEIPDSHMVEMHFGPDMKPLDMSVTPNLFVIAPGSRLKVHKLTNICAESVTMHSKRLMEIGEVDMLGLFQTDSIYPVEVAESNGYLVSI